MFIYYKEILGYYSFKILINFEFFIIIIIAQI